MSSRPVLNGHRVVDDRLEAIGKVTDVLYDDRDERAGPPDQRREGCGEAERFHQKRNRGGWAAFTRGLSIVSKSSIWSASPGIVEPSLTPENETLTPMTSV